MGRADPRVRTPQRSQGTGPRSESARVRKLLHLCPGLHQQLGQPSRLRTPGQRAEGTRHGLCRPCWAQSHGLFLWLSMGFVCTNFKVKSHSLPLQHRPGLAWFRPGTRHPFFHKGHIPEGPWAARESHTWAQGQTLLRAFSCATNVKNLGPRRYHSLLHGVTGVTHKNTAEVRECHLEMSYETNTLASISGLLCLSEMAGSGEGLTRAAQWRGLVGRDHPLP